MKKIINKYQSYLFLVLIALANSSCEDWLTLYPQDRVVEENFWDDKNDLLGVRYAAYQNMQSTLSNFIVWGDLRSDSYILNPKEHSDQGNRDTYKKIMEGLPDSTMNIYDWGGVYTTINYCNKVLAHGDEVLERDKQFTPTEWRQIRAEMITLRAMNYFYLIRAFKDVPYINTIINSDKEVASFPTVNQMTILNTLIDDVESVKGQARNRFNLLADTKGLITNSAIYALLADMYLWRAALREGRGIEGYEDDNRMCIQYCEAAIDALKNQNSFNDASSSNGSFVLPEETDEYGLIQNDFTVEEMPELNAFNAIFWMENSRESIFELQYSPSDKVKNGVVGSFWGYSNGTHLAVSRGAIMSLYSSESEAEKDSRTWYSAMQSLASEKTPLPQPYCFKYTNVDILVKKQGENIEYSILPSGYDYFNWIFYRLTDVMLMEAEAYACLEDMPNANKLLQAIYKRSYASTKEPKYPTDQDGIQLVLKHRQIELLGEGKRWFDLVRYAERIGGGADVDPVEPEYQNGSEGVEAMIDNFLGVTYSKLKNALKNRIKNRWGLYSPIYYMEIKASNGVLKQNPNWNREKYAL